MVATTSSGGNPVGWPARLSKARLHFVTGKGGTGKSTIAAALALTLAAGGRKVLLVEVEGRQGIAQLFDVPPLPYQELKIATAARGGQVNALAIDIEAAFLEYLDMFYNLGIAGRAMRRIGAIEFATTIAPGLRDVLLTGKIKESVVRLNKGGKNPVYDAIVVDAPPTGRIARFLDVTKAVSAFAVIVWYGSSTERSGDWPIRPPRPARSGEAKARPSYRVAVVNGSSIPYSRRPPLSP